MLKSVSSDRTEAEVKRLIQKKAISADSAAEKIVKEIVAAVRKNGDRAVLAYTKNFDKVELTADKLRVSEAEIKKAFQKVKGGFLNSLTKAVQNITAFHRKQKSDEWFETLPLDVVLGQRLIPLTRGGGYVPGGRATYPSSVLMNVIPAKVADVKEIILVSPPPISPYILVAAAEVGVSAIYKVGGAPAIPPLPSPTP